MKRYVLLTCLIFTLTILLGCKKTEKNQPSITPSTHELIREIRWNSFNSKADFFYNPDSTLKTAAYTGSGSSYTVDYHHDQKRPAAFSPGDTFYRYEFEYDNEDVIAHIKRKELVDNRYTEDLEFSYNQDGSIAQLKYFHISGAVRSLISTNRYTYDAANQLSEITSIDKNGRKAITVIESWSETFNFDPLLFMGISTGENYQIYNYPVLKYMKRVPAKFSYANYVNGRPVTEQVVTVLSTIRSKRIEKQTSSVSYPQHPEYGGISEVKFSY